MKTHLFLSLALSEHLAIRQPMKLRKLVRNVLLAVIAMKQRLSFQNSSLALQGIIVQLEALVNLYYAQLALTDPLLEQLP